MFALYIEQTVVLIVCLLICAAAFIWVTILPAIGLLYVFGLLP